MSVINQKEYLKKYLSLGDEKEKSKKRRKKAKIIKDRVKIIDDDIDVPINVNEDEMREFLTAEDAPQVCGIIDERPLSMRIDDYRKSDKWKLVGSDDELKEDKNQPKIKTRTKSSDSDVSPPRKSKNSNKDNTPPKKSRKQSEDQSPPRRNRRYSDSDESPPRKIKIEPDSDVSPPRRSRKDSDSSPPRKSRKNSDSSPARKTMKNCDASPLRRTRKDSDASPPRRTRKDSDENPPRKFRKKSSSPRRYRDKSDSDASPPRKNKRQSDSDVSPPRRNKRKSDSETSLPRRSKKSIVDNSPPRKPKKSSPDLSPARRNKKYSESESKPLRKSRWDSNTDVNISGKPEKLLNKSKYDSDSSPPRKSKSFDQHERKREKRSSSFDKTKKDAPQKKMTKTLDGKTAGIQLAGDLKKETAAMKKREDDMFKNLPAEISGKDAAPIMRDRKTGKKRDLEKEAMEELEKQKVENEKKEKYDKWGKGLKQVEDYKQKIEEELHEMSKPLARYADNEDLERYLKEQEREGDPMLQYIRKRKRKEAEASGKPIDLKPQYDGEFMPNRYGIPPGHRWDGVDRSNGYEKDWFKAQNSKKAVEEDIYKWSTEDM